MCRCTECCRPVQRRLISARTFLAKHLCSRQGMTNLKDRLINLVKSRNWVEWTFLVVGTVSCNIALSITANRILRIQHDSPDLTVGLIIFISTVFSTTFMNFGITKRRQEHMFHFILSYVFAVLYCFFNYVQSHDKSSNKLIRLCVLSSCLPVLLPLAAWLCCFYHGLPREPIITPAENFSGYTRSLILLDTQMEICVWLLLLKSGLNAEPAIWIVFSIGLGCCVSKLALVNIAVLRPNIRCLYVSLAACILEPIVAIYIFYQAATNTQTTVLTALTYLVGSLALMVHVVTTGVLILRAVKPTNQIPELFECCFGVANHNVSTQTLETCSGRCELENDRNMAQDQDVNVILH